MEGLGGGDGTPAASVLPNLAGAPLSRQGRRSRRWPPATGSAERMVITSRRYGYPTAKEAALKLMETSYIPALSYSGADLLHGPLAMVNNISPVIAVVTDGRGGEALQPVLDRLRGQRRRPLRGRPEGAGGGGLGGLRAADVGGARGVAADPGDPCRCRCWHDEVTIARGQDPDSPRALAKVTETR
ncbi:Glutamine-fructose-6-phosphate transaminase OS=Streptomyces microflavus OX=1919 GN=Smic_55980 PE=4 SV=1 [Streptomyces microflavus]